MRKVACLAVFMALMMLVPVQAGGDVSMQQTETEEEDPRQPSKEAKKSTCTGMTPTQKHGLILQTTIHPALRNIMRKRKMEKLKLICSSEWTPYWTRDCSWILMDCSEVRSTSTFKVIGPTITMETPLVVKTIVKN